MSGLVKAVWTVAAAGLVMTLSEILIPRSEIRKSAQIAFSMLFLELLAEQILGIFH